MKKNRISCKNSLLQNHSTPSFPVKPLHQKSVVKPMILATIGFVLFVFHLSKWGSHFVSVVYLKATHAAHIANESQNQKLLSICYKFKNYNCAESALKNYYHSSKDINQLNKLANLQLKRQKEIQASNTYDMYFSQVEGKFDSQAAYNYAKLLDKFGEKEKALEYYNKILNQQGDSSIHVNVVRNKIDLLIRMNKKDKAMNTIKEVKAMTKEHDNYMQQEIKRWVDQVRRG